MKIWYKNRSVLHHCSNQNIDNTHVLIYDNTTYKKTRNTTSIVAFTTHVYKNRNYFTTARLRNVAPRIRTTTTPKHPINSRKFSTVDHVLDGSVMAVQESTITGSTGWVLFGVSSALSRCFIAHTSKHWNVLKTVLPPCERTPAHYL